MRICNDVNIKKKKRTPNMRYNIVFICMCAYRVRASACMFKFDNTFHWFKCVYLNARQRQFTTPTNR